eukprot:SM008735S23886  [mRNA]  locus=s8735:1:429:- [translate_table: standard]
MGSADDAANRVKVRRLPGSACLGLSIDSHRCGHGLCRRTQAVQVDEQPVADAERLAQESMVAPELRPPGQPPGSGGSEP